MSDKYTFFLKKRWSLKRQKLENRCVIVAGKSDILSRSMKQLNVCRKFNGML